MTTPNIAAPEPIAVTLPSTDRLRQAFAGGAVILPAGTQVFRAVRHLAAVIPPFVERTYRFGPPAELAGPDGRFATYWMYAAQDLTTALWESGFCTNDMMQPGTFYIPPGIAEGGLIATFTLKADIQVLDLDGTVLSKLGIYDQIHGEHAWCQWFGLRMLELLAGFRGDTGPVGFRYPSRKHKSHLALAVRSASLETWRRLVDVQVKPFAGMPEFEELRSDSLYAEPLAGGFSVG
ncbi:RES family NAD+ phosphorylase [Cupriavidus alkaliphilus]|uniref:RES family NAD+ phosphorylase n=1 Tax=Cupriavidus alkaliphilus TaxID=942866 RepID=UPI00339DA157